MEIRLESVTHRTQRVGEDEEADDVKQPAIPQLVVIVEKRIEVGEEARIQFFLSLSSI